MLRRKKKQLAKIIWQVIAEKCHHKNVTKPSFNLYNILDTGLIDKIIQVTREEDEQLHGKA